MLKQRLIRWATLLAGTTFAVTSLPGCDQVTSLITGVMGGLLGGATA